MAILYRALLWLGTASIGYFANDIGDGISNYVPAVKDKSTGKIAWYWMVLFLFALALLVLWVINLLFPKKYRS